MPRRLSIEHLGAFDRAPRRVAALAKTFAGGAETSFHRHRRGQLLYAAAGIMRVETAEAAWLVPPARALWMPPRLPHKVSMRSRVEMRTLYIDKLAAAGLPPRPTFFEVGGLLRELILAVQDEPPDYDESGRGGLLTQLILVELARLPGLALGIPMPRDARALRVARMLLDDPGLDLSFDRWADRAGASERTLARVFRAETGLSFGEWRARLRAVEGLACLAGGTSVAQAAARMGYASASAFSAMVRRSLGAPPRRFSIRLPREPR